MESSSKTTSRLGLDEPLGALEHHLSHLDMARCRLVERRRNNLTANRAHHVGHLLGPLVDEEDDQMDLGVIRRESVGDRLEHHRLAGSRGRDDEPALAAAERGHQVDDAAGDVGSGLLDR
jgi:hypothetical protein